MPCARASSEKHARLVRVCPAGCDSAPAASGGVFQIHCLSYLSVGLNLPINVTKSFTRIGKNMQTMCSDTAKSVGLKWDLFDGCRSVFDVDSSDPAGGDSIPLVGFRRLAVKKNHLS